MPRLVVSLASILLSAPAWAEEPAASVPPQQTEEWHQAEQYAREAAEKLLRSLDSVLRAMPYGMPHLDSEGNIVIPRQHPHPLPPDGGQEGPIRS
jgi:hypothetical protein